MMPAAFRRQDGEIAAEFALILPLALFLMGILMVLGFRGLYLALANLEVREAARTASIREGFAADAPYPDPSDVCADAEIAFPGSSLTSCTITNREANSAGGRGTGDIVDVELTYEVTILEPFVGFMQPLVATGGGTVSGFDTLQVRASVMRE